MGISLTLEVIPQRINAQDWENVYEETLKLINNYHFAMCHQEELACGNRWVLDSPQEQEEKGGYWEVCGDLETLETSAIFRLYRDLDRYMGFSQSPELNDDDILLYHLDNKPTSTIFHKKTQGKPYHNYMLAIAALIESRFPGAVILYGDFDRAQAVLAIEWANSILKNPITLPILVDYQALYNRLKIVRQSDNFLEEFLKLANSQTEVNSFIKDNFNPSHVFNYYKNKMKTYSSINKLGPIRLMIDFLNMGYPIEELCNICCLDSDGPMFPENEFIESLCSTWVFIPDEAKSFMSIYEGTKGRAGSVLSQFGGMYLDMAGFQGRHIRRYIPKDLVENTLKGMLKDIPDIHTITETKYQGILSKLTKHQEFTNQSQDEYNEYKTSNTIYDIDYLVYWTEDMSLTEDLLTVLNGLKPSIETMKASDKSIDIETIFGIEDNEARYLIIVSKIVDRLGIILSRNAWNWLDGITDSDIWQTIILLLAFLNRENENTALTRALLENENLFKKFIL